MRTVCDFCRATVYIPDRSIVPDLGQGSLYCFGEVHMFTEDPRLIQDEWAGDSLRMRMTQRTWKVPTERLGDDG